MILTDTVDIRGETYLKTYSDNGMMIERDGVKYDEAIDPVGSNRIYSESSDAINVAPTKEEEKAVAYDILLGLEE